MQRRCNVMAQCNETNTVSQPSNEIQNFGVLLKEVTLNNKYKFVGLIDMGTPVVCFALPRHHGVVKSSFKSRHA